MNAYSRRKPPTFTAREIAHLRPYYKADPATYALPLAARLDELAWEYRAADNLVAARRHINASLRAMRPAMRNPAIPENSRRHIVEFLRDSCAIHMAQGEWREALAAATEALHWDAETWEAHDFCLSFREVRRAYMLLTLARIQDALGDPEGATATRAEAMLVAMSDIDCEEDDVARFAEYAAAEIARSEGFAQA